MTRKDQIRQWMTGHLSELLGIAPDRLDRRKSLAQYGVDSQDLLMMSGTFDEVFAAEVDPSLFLSDEPIEELIAQLDAALSDAERYAM